LGDLAQREAEVVMEDEDGPLLGVEAAKAAFDLIAVRKADARVRHHSVEWPDTSLDGRSPPPRACFAIAGADQEATQPRLEAIWIPQRREVAPGADQRFLGCVLGAFLVTEDQAGNDKEPADQVACQLGERVMIARHRPLDEIPIHRASLHGAALRSR